MAEAIRRCRRCKEDKPPGEFYDTRASSWCRPCQRAYMRARHAATKPPKPKLKAPPANAPNFSREASAHERNMLAIGAAIVRQCAKACLAVHVITDGWSAMNKAA